MADRDTIRQFVKGTLGCSCEDAVFEQLAQSRDVNDDGVQRLRLVVGGRLLIRCLRPVDAGLVRARLDDWLAQGMAERDELGLNRFRLVLGMADAMNASLPARFAADGRVHLHLLPPAALDALFGVV